LFNPTFRHPAARLAVAGVLLALLVILAGNASAVSTSGSPKTALRWDKRTFTSATSLISYLSAQGTDADAFLRAHPAAAGELGLRAVTWDGRPFFTLAGIRSWSLRNGTSVARWAQRHPGAATVLRRNTGSARQTLAVKKCRPSKCSAPKPTAPPVASGTPAVGQAVSVSSGTWSGATPLEYSYRWQRCTGTAGCSAIGGARTQTYAVQSADVGASLRAVVRVGNSHGSVTATSNALAAVPATAPTPPSAGGGAAPVSSPAPAPTPAPAPAPPPTGTQPALSNRFGIATGGIIEWANDANLARELDGYGQIGAGWIRFDIKWSAVEASRGTFNWTIYDRLVSEARRRGLSVVANLAYTPAWARPAGTTDDKFAPANVADFAAFARAAVSRYAPQGVVHYEIWNEPNLSVFWRPAPDAVKYTALLKAAYTAIKSVNAPTQVLAGAFSPAGGYNDPSCGVGATVNINPLNFLETMYANGAKGYFDALSHHPYTGSAPPSGTHRCNAWFQMFGTTPSLRSILTSRGDGDMKIWGTEFGTDLAWVGGSEVRQADQIAEAMRVWRTYSWAAGLMIYSYKQDLEGFNLVRPDWTPRLAWTAYQSSPKT
jgi:hypothetical protein